MKKKIIICLIFSILIPVIFADVTRNIPPWVCPVGFDVQLTESGAKNSYAAEETLGQSWEILGSSHSYTLQDPNLNDGIKKIAFFTIPAAEKIITYTLRIPAGSYSISGVYVLDSGSQKPIGTTPFTVHENTCNAETEDDLDGDEYGKGCICKGPDCNDNNADINPGKPEINNNDVDENCDGCIYKDMDNDGYPTNANCGSADCNDNIAAINPGITESPSLNCDGIDNDCKNGDCCPSTSQNDLSYYDQNCDGNVDNDKKLLFIQNYLAGIINPILQQVINVIPGSGYKNP